MFQTKFGCFVHLFLGASKHPKAAQNLKRSKGVQISKMLFYFLFFLQLILCNFHQHLILIRADINLNILPYILQMGKNIQGISFQIHCFNILSNCFIHMFIIRTISFQLIKILDHMFHIYLCLLDIKHKNEDINCHHLLKFLHLKHNNC